MKKILFPLLTAAALAATSQAAVIFDGSTDSVFVARSSTDVSLNSAAGVHTLTTSTNGGAGYIFGNFASTSLGNVGDVLTLSFTASFNRTDGGDVFTPLGFSLAGNGTLVNANTTLNGFTNFDRFARYNGVGSTAYGAAVVDSDSTNPDQKNLASLVSGGTTGTTAGNPSRFNYNVAADFVLTVTRTVTGFDIGGSMLATGGVLQNYTVASITPTVAGFQLNDSFTTFAIGIEGGVAARQFDTGSSLVFSNVEVDYTAIPEPGTLALVGLSLGALLLFRRRK